MDNINNNETFGKLSLEQQFQLQVLEKDIEKLGDVVFLCLNDDKIGIKIYS